MTRPIFVWFRQDLRISDNPALRAAAESGPVIPLFVLDTTDRPLGGASRWWLHHSLTELRKELGDMTLVQGDPLVLIPELIEKTGAQGIFWNRCYEPHAVARDKKLKSALKDNGIEAKSFRGNVLHEPWTLKTGAGGPFKVYTPFWKAAVATGFGPPEAAPKFDLATEMLAGDQIEDWKLLPTHPDWAKGWAELWSPGEKGALARFDVFAEEGLKGYGRDRDRPDQPNVSRLSPHLHFGEISVRQIFAKTAFISDSAPELANDINKFRSEIGWRDFSSHLLFHFPTLPEKNWKPAFDFYPWRESATDLAAWQQGMTGYPLVDAGMRELWHTGYMHNRVRMIAASFLVKHLRLHWKHGEAWFWDTLVDADLANNSASWQWVAGSGADAAPYFRIFNPIIQGRKFDPEGNYVRRWCPELAKLDLSVLHAPFEASTEQLERAGIVLGKDYPNLLVNHAEAREMALAGYETVRQAG